jgi:hypothetical protein
MLHVAEVYHSITEARQMMALTTTFKKSNKNTLEQWAGTHQPRAKQEKKHLYKELLHY